MHLRFDSRREHGGKGREALAGRALDRSGRGVGLFKRASAGPFGDDQCDRVSARLDTDVLRELNRQVASGEDPSAVAARWLASWGKA